MGRCCRSCERQHSAKAALVQKFKTVLCHDLLLLKRRQRIVVCAAAASTARSRTTCGRGVVLPVEPGWLIPAQPLAYSPKSPELRAAASCDTSERENPAFQLILLAKKPICVLLLRPLVFKLGNAINALAHCYFKAKHLLDEVIGDSFVLFLGLAQVTHDCNEHDALLFAVTDVVTVPVALSSKNR